MPAQAPRLLYITPYRRQLLGVDAKINAQTTALTTEYHVCSAAVCPAHNSGLRRFILRLIHEITIPLRSLFSAQKIYYRYSHTTPLLALQLSLLSFFKPVWIELNTYYRGELKDAGALQLSLHSLSSFFLRHSRVTFLPVTAEIATLEKLPTARYRVLGNGITGIATTINTTLETELPTAIAAVIDALKKRGQKIVVFSASTIHLWHGLDRVAAAIAPLENTHLLIFSGSNAVTEEITELIDSGRCHHYPPLSPAELDNLYSSCDIGLASFGLQHNGLSEGATLKVRSYLAAGLRVITNHRDIVADQEWAAPFFYRIDCETHTPQKLQEYIERSYDRAALRAAARDNLSWEKLYRTAGVLHD